MAMPLVGALLLPPRVALADPPPPPDVVDLNDGSRLTGTLVEAKRGSYVTIDVAGGQRVTLPWAKVKNYYPYGVGAPALPAGAPVAATAPPTTPPNTDVIILKDGSRVEGHVLERRAGEYVSIQASDGRTRTINWDVIREVQMAAPPPASAAGGTGAAAAGAGTTAGTTTTSTLNASDKGASYHQTTDCTRGPNDPKCHSETNVAADQSGVHGSYHSEVDCSKDPKNEKCTEKSNVSLDNGKLAVGYSKETISRVKEPPSAAISFALDVGAGTIIPTSSQSSESMLSLTSDLRIKILLGQQFPGPSGGSWNGIALTPSAAIMSIFASGQGQSTTLLGFQGGGSLGYQYMHFGAMDESTLKQGGFGLELGGYAGVIGISEPTYDMATGQQTQKMVTNANYGPELGLTFPSYNAGTASYSSFSINGFVLPSADGSILLSATLGWIF